MPIILNFHRCALSKTLKIGIYQGVQAIDDIAIQAIDDIAIFVVIKKWLLSSYKNQLDNSLIIS
ncbi:hypothetical protein DVV81_11710 [Clostridium botulinum]|uniref:hypothetical protein n=1 Tax=Clostridium botulinum TaxID=1491 RepID=UPI0019683DE5|nr:hypothetical protein [Clostridium botulinum]MBN1071826.1 hypothetical protein [Clostridium botulinum]